MRNYFDIIILDIPSVNGHSEVLPLCKYGDAYMLVVAQGVTPADQIRAALDDLGTERLAGVVLNRTANDAPTWLSRFTGS